MALGTMNPTVSDAARKHLRNIPSSPFATDGLGALQDSVDRYIHDLLMECVGVMNRHDAPAISKLYVTMAVKNIARQRRKLFALIGIVGGAFLSAAFTSLYELAKAKEIPQFPAIATTFLLFAAGVIMIAYQIARE